MHRVARTTCAPESTEGVDILPVLPRRRDYGAKPKWFEYNLLRSMIRNQEQSELVREQLGRLERALADLEAEARPQSEKQFQLMSEIYVEHIDKLRNEIEEFCQAHPTRRAGDGPGAARRKLGRTGTRCSV